MKGFTNGMLHGGTLVEGREATIYTKFAWKCKCPVRGENFAFFSYEIDNFYTRKLPLLLILVFNTVIN